MSIYITDADYIMLININNIHTQMIAQKWHMISYTFKRWYYGHMVSFRHKENRHCTSLSNYIWLNKSVSPYAISWKIRKPAVTYSFFMDRYKVCHWKKLLIITSNRSYWLKIKEQNYLSNALTKDNACCMITDKPIIILFSTDMWWNNLSSLYVIELIDYIGW